MDAKAWQYKFKNIPLHDKNIDWTYHIKIG